MSCTGVVRVNIILLTGWRRVRRPAGRPVGRSVVRDRRVVRLRKQFHSFFQFYFFPFLIDVDCRRRRRIPCGRNKKLSNINMSDVP